MLLMSIIVSSIHRLFFFFNDPATTEIYTLHIVGSVRCVQETVSTQSTWVRKYSQSQIAVLKLNRVRSLKTVMLYSKIMSTFGKMKRENYHQIQVFTVLKAKCQVKITKIL
eukprot:TRINITY_DN15188_c0_g1_i3.p4 TRINITY_DN15188_c0_g1~~TRINITY_DN15188_c0_g1_i3.p4  ORF type:complete len:111 (+),score=28.26 TRINITY_DN15188_c0_g1_i3:32-364(+)